MSAVQRVVHTICSMVETLTVSELELMISHTRDLVEPAFERGDRVIVRRLELRISWLEGLLRLRQQMATGL